MVDRLPLSSQRGIYVPFKPTNTPKTVYMNNFYLNGSAPTNREWVDKTNTWSMDPIGFIDNQLPTEWFRDNQQYKIENTCKQSYAPKRLNKQVYYNITPKTWIKDYLWASGISPGNPFEILPTRF